MAKDKYHESVRRALIKDGWTITHDPYRFRYLSSKDQEIDLGAEKNINLEFSFSTFWKKK